MVSFFFKCIHLVGFGFLFLPLSLLLFVVELIEFFGSIVFFSICVCRHDEFGVAFT